MVTPLTSDFGPKYRYCPQVMARRVQGDRCPPLTKGGVPVPLKSTSILAAYLNPLENLLKMPHVNQLNQILLYGLDI